MDTPSERRSDPLRFPGAVDKSDHQYWMRAREAATQEGLSRRTLSKQQIVMRTREQARAIRVKYGHYTEYLKSAPEWQVVRAGKLAQAGNTCELCAVDGTREGVTLDVHHLHYDTICEERWCDLIVLCRPCHRAHHKSVNAAAARKKTTRKQ